MADQHDDDKSVKSVETPLQSLSSALDSGLVRSTLAVPIVVVVHLILAKLMEEWSVLELCISVVFLIVPAVAWVFWPQRVVEILRSAWKFWRRVYPVVGAVALSALIIIIVYWLSHRAPEKPRIRFTCDSWIGWAPLYIAKEKKFFGETQFEIILGHGSGEKRKFVYRGDADAIGETIDMLEFSSSPAAVAPGVILWAADRSAGGDAVVASPAVTTLADLVGKTVGLEVGTPTHYMLIYHFNKNGLAHDGLHIRDLLGPEATEKFLNRELDATAAWDPHLQQALKREGSHTLLSSKEMTGDFSVRDVVAVNKAFLNAHPEAVRDFFIGWCAAIRYMKEHPNDAYKIMADNYHITVNELKKQLNNVEFYDYEENVKLFSSGQQSPIVSNVLSVRSVWQSAGFARDVDPIESRVSPEVIKSVSADDIDARLRHALGSR